MNIYFLAPAEDTRLALRVQTMREILERAGANVSYRVGKKRHLALSAEEQALSRESGLSMLDPMDGFVIESTHPDIEINYALAQAIIQRKPTLCLYEKARPPRDLLVLLKQKNVPDVIEVKAYTDATLENVILSFLPQIEAYTDIELPTIKFTLRITRKIERYLNWKGEKEKIAKADFLRNLLKALMEGDAGYQHHLKAKKE